jgi:spermidine synthase
MFPRSRDSRLGCLFATLGLLLLASCQPALVHETRSPYSQIRVIDYGSKRALVFAGEGGEPGAAVETLIDLREPHRLQHSYARTMMVAHLYRPQARSCLLVGLGGGALVQFLNRHFPELLLDVVEIDPVVVAVSREYFGTEPGPRTRILTEDAFDFLRRTESRYDLLLMDAHLNPGKATDDSGYPLHLRTLEFLRGLRERLNPGGVVLFNMIEGRDTASYLDDIRRAFAAVAIYRPTGSGNLVVVAAPTGFGVDEQGLRERARALDRRGGFGFSFERVLDERVR